MASKPKHYTELDVSKWNTAHFQSYLADKHSEKYGIQYAAAGGIMAERAHIAKHIGTSRKPGLYSREVVKAFIDGCFDTYKPTQTYPGLTFWFMVTFMPAELQRAELAGTRKKAENNADDYNELEGWL